MAERAGIPVSRQSLRGPLGDLLERFRRSGGVPAAAADLTSELAPVFAALDEIEREADAVRRAAEAERIARAASLEREVAEVMERARVEGDRARDEAYETALRAAEAEAAGIVAEGESEAATIRAVGEERLPRIVAAVVAVVVGAET